MNHQRKKSLPQLLGGTKTLIMEFKAKTALLFDGRSLKSMRFENTHTALTWCEENAATFYCMHADRSGRN